MATIALLLNVIGLIPVCLGLITNAAWATESYGGSTPARNILLAVYMAIIVTSAVLLFTGNVQMIAALLIVQVIYKVMTPFTVGSFKNPVVISNLFIAAFHAATLVVIWQS